MKLYYCPGACSLANHIALREAGAPFESESVDLRTKTTATGVDFNTVSAKGYVPVLELDNGELLTENLAVLDYIAANVPSLGLDGTLGRTRLLEALAYISTEVHKSFKPYFKHASEEAKSEASNYINSRLQYLSDSMQGTYLFGSNPTVADFYLFVTLMWAEKFGVPVPESLVALRNSMKARPAVRATLEIEGLI